MNYSILHVITTIDLGGAEKQLLTLSTCQRKAGFEVEVIFLKDKPTLLDSFLESGVKVDLDFAESGFCKQYFRLKKRNVQENLVVHAHLPRAELLCALALKPKSFVVTRHNSEPFFPKGPKVLSKLLSRFVLRKSFASISISKAVEIYLKNSGEICSLETNSVIYYGLRDTSISSKEIAENRVMAIQIGTVSRLAPQKNLPLLLSALQELNSMGSSRYELSVVGVGPLKKELQSLAMELGVGNAVFWKGQSKDVLAFYRSLDLFVLPSDYEGFGLVLLEAMSQGIPVIARRVSAIPEVLGDKHPGLVDTNNPSDLAQKIQKMSEDRETLNSCLRYQAKRIQEFSIQKTQKAHERVYMTLFEQRG